MTRHGKIAGLPGGLRSELNLRLAHGELIKQATPEQKGRKMGEILALGGGFDGSKTPELTRPPWLRCRNQPEPAGVNRSCEIFFDAEPVSLEIMIKIEIKNKLPGTRMRTRAHRLGVCPARG